MFCLIDCNNFYASCEVVFNPKLQGKAFVVLSNNDGIIIARSQEARDMGIPMGAPIFQHKGVKALSSNFTLYGDMSDRVMSIISDLGYPTEIYSIDEAFLQVDAGFNGEALRKKIKQWTGIPTSIGLGKTKTLAKVANKCCKKKKAFDLQTFPVEDVWGIGRQYAKLLHSFGVTTASELMKRSDAWIKKHLKVPGLKTVWELRGQQCIDLEEVREKRKGIVSSRTFGTPLAKLSDLKEAIASFVSIAAAKLRKEHLRASYMAVFLSGASGHVHIPVATSSTPQLMNLALSALEKIYKEGDVYKRGGVMLSNFSEKRQLDLFTEEKNDDALMHTMDVINRRYDKKAVYFASEGSVWKPRQIDRSQNYTTRWEEIPTLPVCDRLP